jgi:molybdopterin-containing oxidoreductase family iron-sulfur binding subunit
LLDVPPLIHIGAPPPEGEPVPARSTAVDLAALRANLEAGKGAQFWRSLEEIADTGEFRKFIDDEFPERAPDWADKSQRRTFLKVMGASLALAGVSACTKQPPEAIVPYVRQPEDLVPGKPLFYATARPCSGGAIGVLAESHQGRPTKIEGNPTHPASLGATDAFTQASILDLWDPDRAQAVTRNGNVSSWSSFAAVLAGVRDGHETRQGAGLTILSAPISSPTLRTQMQAFLAAMPRAKWRQWEPLMRIPGYHPVYNFAEADVVVSLDSDSLATGPGSVRYARDFAGKRRVMVGQTPEQQKRSLQSGPDEVRPEGPAANETYAREAVAAHTTMNRLYVVEGTPSVTGMKADHRVRLRTSEIPAFAAELARAVGASGAASDSPLPDRVLKPLQAIAKDLQAHRGASLVVAGDYQPAAVHALAYAMNQALGNVGKTVSYAAPLDLNPVDNIQSIRELVADMNAGQVETLLILGGNPVYDAPSDLDFAGALKKVKLRAHLAPYFNETSAWCQWHLPETHYLETWGDARAYDGTVTIQQPLIQPLYGGVSAHQVLNVLVDKSDLSTHDLVKNNWSGQGGANFKAWWQRALNDGVVPGSAATTSGNPGLPAGAPLPSVVPRGTLEIVFRPDPAIWDGSFSNNGWMQELPKPQNKMTWDNGVWISPHTAESMNLENEDLVEIEYRGRKVTGPLWVMPGHADDSVTVHLGFGRTRAGRVGDGVGFNAYALRTSDAPWVGADVRLRKTGRYSFATTQHTQTMEAREPVKVMTFADYQKDPEVEAERIPRELTMYGEYPYTGYKWGMSIDLNACTGCQACNIACQAENNIPVVGKDQVSRGRQMQWIRIDRYYRGGLEDPEVYVQPVPCMHCETAPCEVVCPVGATVHSGDGLNQMVYNRCVGTRYCSNNCPYKVRRFNFYLYSDWYTQSLYGLRNPDVTVRSRGVMEKCTYCVQRINAAKIESEKEDRRIEDGEIIPACAQACPTQAIVFGDINDPNSRVAKLKAQPRDYSLLEELNTRPRTTYLARLRNVNPEIEKG